MKIIDKNKYCISCEYRFAARFMYVFLVITALCLPVQNMADVTGAKKDSADMLRSRWQHATEQGDLRTLLSETTLAYSMESDSMSVLSMYASVMAGRAYALMQSKDSMELWLGRAERCALYHDSPWALGALYSSYAMYAMDNEGNYYKAVSLFTKGLKATEGRDLACYYTTKGNLALTYYLRNDPSGLQHAMDVLEYGHKIGDGMHIFIGSLTSSYLLHLKGEDIRASEVIVPAVESVDRFYNRTGVYALYADILSSLGKDEEALVYFMKAFQYLDSTDVKSTTDAYANYGKYLIKRGEADKAISLLDRQLAKSGNPLYYYELYKVMADAYKAKRDWKSALSCLEIYESCTDSIFRSDREHSVNELLVSYETDYHKTRAYENEIRLLKANRTIIVFVMLSVIVLAALTVIIVFYVRKNRRYSEIIRKYKEELSNEKKEAKMENQAGNDKLMCVFSDLDRVMKQEKLYRNKGVTIETVASHISSNRTYISNAINLFAGVPFNNYINQFRIDEAVRILSDPENDMPIKELSDFIGFTTLNTFYRIFKTSVGMPPSMFRVKMRSHVD